MARADRTIERLGKYQASTWLPLGVREGIGAVLSRREDVLADDLQIVLRLTRELTFGRASTHDVEAAVRTALWCADHAKARRSQVSP